jgi:hypothetical protein
MGDTGLEPVTSALSNRPVAQATMTYTAESACLLVFPATSDFAAPRCPVSFVGRMWEDSWEARSPNKGAHRHPRPDRDERLRQLRGLQD